MFLFKVMYSIRIVARQNATRDCMPNVVRKMRAFTTFGVVDFALNATAYN
jgi:hypothetical protein